MSASAVYVQCLQGQRMRARRDFAPRMLHARDMLLPMGLFVVLVLQLWVRMSFVGQGYRLEELRQKALNNDARLREQRLEYAMLTRPDGLRKQARNQLQMIVLEPQNVRKIQP